MSNSLGGILFRIVVSIAVSIIFKQKFEMEGYECVLIGIMVYSLFSYYLIYLREVRKENDDSDSKYGYHYAPGGCFTLLLEYFFVPCIIFSLIVAGGVWVLEKLLPAAWEDNASLIWNLILILFPIGTDVKTIIDTFQFRKQNKKEEESALKEEKHNVDYYLDIEFGKFTPDNNEYEDVPSERKIVTLYQEELREQGIPEEVLALMNRSGMTFSQCMDLKDGYEFGFTYEQLLRISSPGLERSERKRIINRIICLRNI